LLWLITAVQIWRFPRRNFITIGIRIISKSGPGPGSILQMVYLFGDAVKNSIERYISWMIPSINAYGTKFLYGKIEQPLQVGTYTITMVLSNFFFGEQILDLKGSKVNYVPKIQLLSDIRVLANRELGIIMLCTSFLAVAIVILTFVLKLKLKRN
jgi:hypothetical protein